MDPVILNRVQDALFATRVRAEAEQAERRSRIYAEIPRIADIDAELGSSAAQIARAALNDGSDPTARLNELRARSVDMRLERERLLEQAGYPTDALEVHHVCPICGDTGILPDGAMCSCLLKMYADEQLSELEKHLPVRTAGFDRFDEMLYPDVPFGSRRRTQREDACAVRDFCYSLATAPKPEHSLFIYGDVGTGKTFLAAATAAEASRHGKSVACRSMGELVALYEREKFTRDDDIRDAAASEIDRLMSADLLIIDDFGAEFHAPFGETVVMSILSSRLRRGLPMLICSCFAGRDELNDKYPPQVVSHLLGNEFLTLPLHGPDLRRAKK